MVDLESAVPPRTVRRAGPEGMTEGRDPVALARRGMESLSLDRTPSHEEIAGLEAIINAELRPAIDVVDGTFTVTHPLWTRLSDDLTLKARIEGVIPCVGRIELPGHPKYPYGGTGFVVGDGLIMTNRHVAGIFATGLGDRNLAFVTGAKAGIDFLREQGRPTGPTLMVRRIVMIHPYWDMAILAVDGLPAALTPLRLSLTDARDLQGHDIFVLGYPAFDPRNPSDVQQDLFDGRYGVKRLQPGELQGGMKAASFGKIVPAATHDCSTLGGNSGSAVFDLDTGEAVALHFGGRYHEQNYAVPASELARDGRVIATGVAFAGTPVGGANEWSDWWRRADTGEAVPSDTSTPAAPAPDITSPAQPQRATTTPSIYVPGGDGSVSIEIPLRITISLGLPAGAAKDKAPGATESVTDDGLEALREPFHDADYSGRTGYDSGFLNAPGQDAALAPVDVPMPVPADPAVLASTRSGGDTLHYQNFSIKMHVKRRLALICASNVTEEPRLREPEPGRDYSRKGLSGLGKNDQERWFLDTRLQDQFQIPDAFFTKDRGAFDKGHIVRRDDVAWGITYESLRRANGDTYHVTNCSPQVAGFNRSTLGSENWGDLENHVLSEAANERLCVFAGPVLGATDEIFVGRGDGGVTLRAQIPSRYWKVIVSRVEDGIAAYGFVLEQDLSDVPFEFAVPAEYVPAMYPIEDIEEMAGVSFDVAVRDADQYETVRGAEVGLRSGASRKRSEPD
jgi:endonuclease G, mitochondrial